MNSELLKDKHILVTGGTGSIGSEIVRQLLSFEPEMVSVFSRDEHRQFSLRDKLRANANVRCLLGDVRDWERVCKVLRGVDVVFHAAALKSVPSCECNPFEAVETNVRGTQNVLSAAVLNGVQRVVVISTDKSVNPVSVMGATKLLAERLVSNAQFAKDKHETLFTSVRFGNVLGTRGSVLPLFHRQIRSGGPVTVTEPKMTRFMMLISDAVRLAFSALEMAQGGDLFILKMPMLRLGDFAQATIEELAPDCGIAPSTIKIVQTGMRPGEKMDEELMTLVESRTAQETDTMFIVSPMIMETFPYRYEGAKSAPSSSYASQNQKAISVPEIRQMIRRVIKESPLCS